MTNQFQNIVAWQKAHKFVLLVYRATKTYLDFEKFGLCSQFQRAAVSIPANIAEGYKKLSRADKLRFYNIAQESLEECSKTLNAYCKGEVDNNFGNEL